MSLIQELQRRNVFRVAIGYIVSSWLLMQVADLVLDNIGAPAWVMQTIMLVLVLGFPVVVFFSWAYEVTPEGVKRESEVDRSESISHVAGRKLDRAIIAVLVIALVYFAYDKFALTNRPDVDPVEHTTLAGNGQPIDHEPELAKDSTQSIAVLPFVNMSDDASNEHFSEGLSEELLNLLAKIPQLRVAARTSSFSFKGKDVQISEISEILGVSHVLEGSVRKAGNQVRITAQLIKADTGYHLWSESYDRSLDDIFAVQEDIASRVAEQLRVTLLADALTVPVTDPTAYSLYLQAKHLGRQNAPEATKHAHGLLQQALSLAPDYSPALIELANNLIRQSELGLIPITEALGLAEESLQRVLMMDQENGEAYAVLGWIEMLYHRNLPQAADHLEKAMELDPINPRVINNSAVLSGTLGRFDDAITLLNYLAATDPVDPQIHHNLGTSYILSRQPARSISSFQTALRLSPGRHGSNFMISTAYLLKGDPQAALEAIAQEPNDLLKDNQMPLILFSKGRDAEYEAAVHKLIKKWGDESATGIASVYAWAGNIDRAFSWVEKALENSDPNIALTPFWPTLDNLHNDTRWIPFLERIGFSPQQLNAIEFKIALPE